MLQLILRGSSIGLALGLLSGVTDLNPLRATEEFTWSLTLGPMG